MLGKKGLSIPVSIQRVNVPAHSVDFKTRLSVFFMSRKEKGIPRGNSFFLTYAKIARSVRFEF